ncbi:phosphotransferase enzyme family protein [Ceratobasidium sp. AG-Ba]|nr:phosphotransferase enzyme family protein [Ceratobasidium sp. AG-Ba]
MLGGLRFDNGTVLATHPDAPPSDKYIIPGPVVEETFWQTPDIARYWNTLPDAGLANIGFEDLNVTGPFDGWLDWVLAWLRVYEMQVLRYPRLEFCRERIASPLRQVIELLEDPDPARWVQVLKKNEGGRSLYLSSKDLHGGNILVDDQGTIHAFIDWEFAGFVPSFDRQSDPIQGFVWMAKKELGPEDIPSALHDWPKRFSDVFRQRDPSGHAEWVAETNSDSLGVKGAVLHDLWNYLRCVIEVCVRDQGNVNAGKGAWLQRVEKALGDLLAV